MNQISLYLRLVVPSILILSGSLNSTTASGPPNVLLILITGFVRPHLPFCVPKKYWDLYDAEMLPMPQFEDPPLGSPAVAGKHGGEITTYKPVPVNGQIGAELKRKLIHGYYASTSFVDSQVGKLVAALDSLALADNTIVVLWGDHGFHLGDLGIWTKHTNYEQANRIPLLFIAPNITKPGTSTKQLAESVDIFPTLAELAGLPDVGESLRDSDQSLGETQRLTSARRSAFLAVLQ